MPHSSLLVCELCFSPLCFCLLLIEVCEGWHFKRMTTITFAAKANAAFLLPALLAATYIQRTSPNANVTIVFEDVQSLGPQEGKVELKSSDGSLVYDDAVLPHLQEKFEVLQVGNKDQVCLADSPASPPSHQYH